MILTKTDYILWRECAKNVWYKLNRPDIYSQAPLSDFEKQIIETGNEVDVISRQLFPSGVLVEGRGEAAQKATQNLISNNITDVGRPLISGRGTPAVLFQPVFSKDGFFAATDILELNGDGTYNIYEVKSTTDIDKKTHFHDLAFQVNLLEICGLKIRKTNLLHLNNEYVRKGNLNINQLFKVEDVTETVGGIKSEVMAEMKKALQYLSRSEEPTGYCDCVYKGRSNHCSTFHYSNPKVPEYGIHDITRIGASKKILQDLVDVGIFHFADITEDTVKKLSLPQQNQVRAFLENRILSEPHRITEELGSLQFPLYFLDYETFPCAIPRFDGFSPYQQVPFQYSLYVLGDESLSPVFVSLQKQGTSEDARLEHYEFIFTENKDPSLEFVKSLQANVGERGSIIVWNKGFECKINNEIAKRHPDFKLFIDQTNARVYDLMEIFSKQYYVHKGFKGRVSIKNVLPVLVPELSYKDLAIQEGGTASQKWNELVVGNLSSSAQKKIIRDLKEYCKRDTYAMYAIWKYLQVIIG